MPYLKRRLHRKNASNLYDTIHLESSSDLILTTDGTILEDKLISLPGPVNAAGTGITPVSVGQFQISNDGYLVVRTDNGTFRYKHQPIYRWNRYSTISTTIYYWNRFRVTTATYHFWDRYEAEVSWSLVRDRNQGGSIDVDGWYNEWRNFGYLAESYEIQADGTINLTGNKVYVSSESTFRRYYSSHPCWSHYSDATEGLPYLYRIIYYTGGNTIITYYTYEAEKSTDKGTAAGEVKDTVSTTYPQDGVLGEYWYTYRGEETVQEKGSSYGTVSSTSRNYYPNDGVQGNYWYTYRNSGISYSQGSYIDQVTSLNQNQYPTNGRHSDGYWYVRV